MGSVEAVVKSGKECRGNLGAKFEFRKQGARIRKFFVSLSGRHRVDKVSYKREIGCWCP